jgi:hypothetical protein
MKLRLGVSIGLFFMALQGVRGQNECESEDGRLGWCVLTTDPESLAACFPSGYDIEVDVYADCDYLEVLSEIVFHTNHCLGRVLCEKAISYSSK